MKDITDLIFDYKGSAIGAVLEFSDDAGNVLATMEKKTTCRDSIASVRCFILPFALLFNTHRLVSIKLPVGIRVSNEISKSRIICILYKICFKCKVEKINLNCQILNLNFSIFRSFKIVIVSLYQRLLRDQDLIVN